MQLVIPLNSTRETSLLAKVCCEMDNFDLLTCDMVIGATWFQDIKFPLSLDVYDLCTSELQQRLVPARELFKADEDQRVELAQKVSLTLDTGPTVH